jgi:hypothetical protein
MIVQAEEMQQPKSDRRSRAGFKPHKLFDHLIDSCGFKNDADIAVKLKATAPAVSRIRHKNFKVGPTMILAVYDATDLSIEQIRELL